MVIQVFLTAALGIIALVMTLQRTTSGVVRLLILAVIAAGALFVWMPEATTEIAESLGVGRGADLLLYVWVVITFAVILVLYLEMTRLSRRLTQLARALALLQARDEHDRGRSL